MRHRLLHSLVFSSSFLLDACATTHGSGADAGPTTDAPTPSPDAATPAVAIPDAAAAPDAVVTDAFVPPDAFTEDAGEILRDPRACEPGWPTTKGVFDIERDGVWYGCRHGVTDPEEPDLSLCCIVDRSGL